ncbi:hypothetical protein BpHYR1_009210 [Brachionus plicatilis]|uniref:Uncharacterized protein n=1 Tax=Brachionus plicatilis TaxID=10195 RepID=A0A3M7PTY7_BRAPC|nr:hypothetical protein BpHYR1_009210 [Brachionus plicatilis]
MFGGPYFSKKRVLKEKICLGLICFQVNHLFIRKKLNVNIVPIFLFKINIINKTASFGFFRCFLDDFGAGSDSISESYRSLIRFKLEFKFKSE